MIEVALRPRSLFKRTAVRAQDEAVFVGKLVVLALMVAGGVALALHPSYPLAALGVLVLAAAYTHGVYRSKTGFQGLTWGSVRS